MASRRRSPARRRQRWAATRARSTRVRGSTSSRSTVRRGRSACPTTRATSMRMDVAVGLKQEAKLNPGKVSGIVYHDSVDAQRRGNADPADALAGPAARRLHHLDAGLSDGAQCGDRSGGAANIPVISLLGQSTDKHAVNLQPNPIQLGYFGAKGLVSAMGGKGNVLIVDGIPGLSIDTGILEGGKAVLKACGHQRCRHGCREVRPDDRQDAGADVPVQPPRHRQRCLPGL